MSTTERAGRGSIITPEAVVLDFELAGVGARALAYAIDFTVQLVALVVLLLGGGALSVLSPTASLVLVLVSLILVVLGYPVAMEMLNNGKTLGRMVVGTRVVTVEGAPVRFRQAFVRALLGIVDLLATAGALAVVSALVTRRGQRVGDLVAGTMVLREVRARTTAGPVVFYPPAYLAGWSQTVDTSALDNEIYQLVRDFVTRPDLTDNARVSVADELAALVSERLPHAAKTPQVPSMDYLTAIATAVQYRSGARQASPPPPVGAPTRGPVPPAASTSGSRSFVPPPPAGAPVGQFVPPPAAVPPAPGFSPTPAGTPAAPGFAPIGDPTRPARSAPVAPQPPAPVASANETPAASQPNQAPNDGGFAAPG